MRSAARNAVFPCAEGKTLKNLINTDSKWVIF